MQNGFFRVLLGVSFVTLSRVYALDNGVGLKPACGRCGASEAGGGGDE